MTPLWRNRDFTLLWSGQVISSLGAAISSTATPLLVLATTGSPLDAGLVGAAGTLPHLIANLPAGPLIDRWNRSLVLLISEIVAAVALLSVPPAIWFGVFTIAQLCVVAFVQGLCFVFFGLAQDAALPMVVPSAQLATAIAANEARSRGATLAGPPIGGFLFGLDRAAPFLVDGISYLIAAAGLLFLRRDLQKPPEGPAEPLWRSAITGIRYVWRQPLIRVSMLLIAVSNLVFQALILVIVVLAGDRGATSSDIGVMLGLYSAGGLLGAVAASRLHRHFSFRTVLIGINWVWAVLLPLNLLATNHLQIGLIGALSAFVGPLWNVVIMTYAGVVVPNELLGRVMSAAGTLTWGVMPIASLAAGLMLTWTGTTGSLWALSAIMLAAAIAATLSPAVRRAPTLDEAVPV
ncbi:MFS transporter [Actinoplanes philippinensis]|uniref:Predicted arabinose efflux permease, MFS family n=1 Tax=Actinoplanes philippinensis TaxID=35752 RepID=A0A1I2A4E3_9ACTN|nr:MFS transporter [Actinoplanes philippinensis]GIE75101.1 MFS transporter [Actinoplanes philippinensis]SFE38667.1 Predicted arabinose efflux permease, MFS family [Actinoplanes philippinensis]